VLADEGYQAARVDDIVRVAKMSHGTFYLYFTDKEDLIRALATEAVGEMVDLATSLDPVGPGPEGLAAVRDWLTRFVATFRRHGMVIRVFMEDRSLDPQLLELGMRAFGRIGEALVARITEAGGAPGHRPELIAAALLAMIERYTYIVVSRGMPVDEERMLGTLAALIHRGFFHGVPQAAPAGSAPAGSA
jgi:AcrR family transcriptional regulator